VLNGQAVKSRSMSAEGKLPIIGKISKSALPIPASSSMARADHIAAWSLTRTNWAPGCCDIADRTRWNASQSTSLRRNKLVRCLKDIGILDRHS
jgi:hypothetical protein